VGSYYYLMAQLPYLIYDQKPPMTSASFKTLAQYFLNEKDAVFMDRLSLNPVFSEKDCGSDFIDNWKNWEYALKLNLGKERAIKLKKENLITSEPPFFPLEAAAAASKAIDEHSPLEGELVLDKARWIAIDSLAGNDNFHREGVYAYFLKLLLLERRQSFNVEKGFAEYKSLYASIVESAQHRGEHT